MRRQHGNSSTTSVASTASNASTSSTSSTPNTGRASSIFGKPSAEETGRTEKNRRGSFLSRISSFGSSSEKDFRATIPKPMEKPLRDLWQNRLNAAKLAVADHPEAFVDNGAALLKTIQHRQNQLNNNALPAGEHKTFEKDLKAIMAENVRSEHLPDGKKGGPKYAKKEAERLFKDAVVKQLNQAQWKTIHTSYTHEGATFTNEMRPAGEMGSNGHGLFAKDYNGQGVASGTTKSKDHAVNMYSSHLGVVNAEGEESSFTGIRHGINSAYGMPARTKAQKAARAEASVERSKELVVASLAKFKSPDALKHAMNTGEPISLRLASTSLVTPMDFFGQTEGAQLRDQVGAWEHLNAMSSKDGHIQVQMRDENNQVRNVNVKFEAATTNFGVNEAALTHKIQLGSFALKLDAGWNASDEINGKNLSKILGPGIHDGGPIGGWAADYLAENPNARNKQEVQTLHRQIGEIWRTQSHRTDKFTDAEGKESPMGEPYKMAARLAVLTHEIGAAPLYNCKSGKDRTGALDGEIKFLVAYHAIHHVYPEPGAELSGSTQELYRKCMMETGNGEVQKQNTGAPGNKVFKKLSFNNLSMRERIGDNQLFDEIKGQSGLVKS